MNTFVDVLTEAVSKCDDVMLIGLRTFSVAKTFTRIDRNFKTGKSVKIPASNYVKLRPRKTLRGAVKQLL